MSKDSISRKGDGNRPHARNDLLVEDEPAVRRLFVLALTRGLRVYPARNGQEALKLFDEHGDSIDPLLTDLRMPHMDGAHLAQRLHARRKTLKMIAISGYAGSAEHELTADFLAKPFSRDQAAGEGAGSARSGR